MQIFIFSVRRELFDLKKGIPIEMNNSSVLTLGIPQPQILVYKGRGEVVYIRFSVFSLGKNWRLGNSKPVTIRPGNFDIVILSGCLNLNTGKIQIITKSIRKF